MKRFFVVTIAAAVAAILLLSVHSRQGSGTNRGNEEATAQAGHSNRQALTTGQNTFEAMNTSQSGHPAVATHAHEAASHAAVDRSKMVTGPVPSSRRAWDTDFIDGFQQKSPGAAVRFELTEGSWAEGTIAKVERRHGQVVCVRGELTSPEKGNFFFQKQTEAGLQGDFAGVVAFPASGKAYRIEPTGPDGASELVKRKLEEVMCILPPPAGAIAEEIPPLDPSDFPDYPIPAYQDGIISLQSLPGAVGVLYIDYRGGYNDNNWGSFPYEKPNVSNAQIKDVWKRVAEDFIPFNINVTTDIRIYQAAPESSRIRCAVTPTTTAAPGAGGVAWMNSWNWTGDVPCWAFGTSGKYAAEIISHEVGHTLSLGHDGNSTDGYYGGQGSGSVGWAPIMGVGYYQPVAQWSKGEYNDANNKEDDLLKIDSNNNSVDYKADDTGPNFATSRYLEVYSNNTVSAEGVIERTADTDAFRFTTTGGVISLRADPAPGEWADLAIMATLADQNDTIIASNNPQSQLWASIATTVPAGSYTFRVTGAGRNNPLTDGFSNYASIGYYSVTGTVAGARQPSRFSIPENSPFGTVAGTVSHPYLGTHSLGYSITSGNTSNAFAINSAGVLTVLNPAVLNYEALAQKTQLTIQFELFVNITDYTNPNLSESLRRVVVAITDVNEAPVATGFTNTVLTATKPGTAIGSVIGNDPDFYNILQYAIVSGNSNDLFAIDLNEGTITVNKSLGNDSAGVYDLAIQVSDTAANPKSTTTNVRLTVVQSRVPFESGSINYAVYDDIGSGALVSDLTSNARFPNDPTWEHSKSSFEGDIDRADNYGSAFRGYLVAPMTGSYYLYIASDDNSELRFSTTTNPATATVVAQVTGASTWTNPRQWNKFASQRSASIFLTAGQGYYIEARQKEGGGGDNLAVGWSGPATGYKTNVIPGLYLAPYPLNYVPHADGFTGNVRRDALQGSRIQKIVVTDANVSDTHTFEILSGNYENIFSVDSNGYIVVQDAAALAATASSAFYLQVQVTDSASSPLSTTCAITLNVIDAGTISATTIRREMFFNVGSTTALTDLTSNPKYPGRPDELDPMIDDNFESAKDSADAYGSRVRALVIPPVSGDYRFFIAADDTAQLKFSYSTNPLAATVIANLTSYTDAKQWNKYITQSGLATGLVAGQPYYIEAVQKENGGGDHVSVGWLVPGSGVTNVIPAANLLPVDLNYAPTVPAQTLSVFPTVANGAGFGFVTANDSPMDTLTFQIVSGNTGGTFAIDPATGKLLVANNSLIASGSVTSFALTIRAQDSGYGGQYPLHSGTGTVTVNVGSANMPYVWMGGGNGNRWSDYANWAGVTPPTGARIVFGQPYRASNINDVATSLASVLFTNGGFYCSGNPLALQYGITNTGANTWAIPTSLSAQQTWSSLSGELNVAAPVTNNGFGWTLVANGDVRVSGPIYGSGVLTKSGTGRLLMGGTHYHSGLTSIASAGTTATALELSGSPLVLAASSLTMNGRMDMWNQNATVGALYGSGTIFANAGIRTLTIGANNASGTFTGVIQDRTWASGVTLKVVKTGTGTQTFSAVNTFSGGLVVDKGQMVLSSSPSGNDAGHGAAANPITINDGAQLIYAATRGAGFHTGPVTINSGASIRFNGMDNNLGCGNVVTLNGGSIGGTGQVRIRGGNASSPRYVSTAVGASSINVGRLTLTADNGMTNAVLDVADGDAAIDLLITSAIDGQFGTSAEGLLKTGAGSLRLAGACTYAGPTVVSTGRLFVDGALAGSGLTARWGTTLGGNGTIASPVTLETGAFLAPGLDGIGKLALNGTTALNGNVLMEINFSNSTNDVITSTGTLTYGGSLTVTQLDTTSLAAGSTFQLFAAAAYSGNFASTNLPALPAGLRWVWAPQTGTLSVANSINLEPPTITTKVVGNSLELTWPADRTGWTLQQLNLDPTSMDPTNWVDMDLSTQSNSNSIPIDPAVPGKLFRMKYQQ